MDGIAEWTAGYDRVTALLSGLDDAQADTTVPATPAWTVRELASHMIGLDADVVRGDEPDDHNDGWTQGQVDERAGRSVAELLDEWAQLKAPVQDWMRANNTRPMGDMLIHEQDIRGAVGVSGAHDTDGMHALRDRMVGGFGDAVDGRPAIALVGDAWQWCSSGEPADAAVVVRAPDFDLTRALMSRRSAAQLRSWTERGDVDAYLDAFGALGPLPEQDLSE